MAGSGKPYDVLVVGGGIYGACIAAACASVSLRTILIERNGFGQGTSAASLRILHGGIRYLQNADVSRIRASLRSRAWFAGLEPSLVRGLDCTVPTRGTGLRSRASMSLALRAYRLMHVGMRRAQAIGSHTGVPRTFDRQQAHSFLTPWAGDAAVEAFSGMARWPECVLLDPSGMVEAIVRRARVAGAQVFDRVELQALRPGMPVRASLRSQPKGEMDQIDARAVILACGPGVHTILGGETDKEPGWILGANLAWLPMRWMAGIVGIPAAAVASVQDNAFDKGHRDLFVVSDGEVCLAGTEYGLVPEGASPALLAEELGDRLRLAMRGTFAGFRAEAPGPGSVLWGWLPGDPDAARAGRVRLLSEAWVVEHRPCIWQVAGTKFAEAPNVAVGIAATVARRGGMSEGSVRTGIRKFWSGLGASTSGIACQHE